MTFIQWFMLGFWNNVTVLVIVVLIIGLQVGSLMARGINR